jgi:ribonuclease P protein component
MAFTFKKEEHLCSRQLIDRLYTEGHRLMVFPYSVQWMTLESGEPLRNSATQPPSHPATQVMIVAPKRKFHHAVDRNRVRRLTRECYRLRKHTLYDFLQQNGLALVFSMVYIHNEIMTFDQLGHKMDKLLAALQKDIRAHQQPTP